MAKIKPWIADPAWQNFSSLVREATTAQEASTGMEKSHHLTASLYFGIAALEAFLNDKMRVHLEATKSEQEIVGVVRKGQIISKLKNWPTSLLGTPFNVNQRTLDLITVFNDVRGELTHPKTHGHDTYGTRSPRLDNLLADQTKHPKKSSSLNENSYQLRPCCTE